MVHLVSLVPIVTFAASALAAPSPAPQAKHIKLPVIDRSKRGLPPLTNPDGTFNKGAFQIHVDATRAKYAAGNAAAKSYKGSLKTERASGSVALGDVYEAAFAVDDYYYGNVNIGTPAQTLAFDFDTGSADFWVPGTNLGTGGFYQSSRSSTFHNLGGSFSIQYGSGTVSGTTATETLTVGGLTVPNSTFAVARTVSSNFVGSEFAGLVGLAFGSIAQTRAPTFFEKLVTGGTLTSNIFAFYLGRGGGPGSELSIGAVDSAKFTGAITYTPVAFQTYWEVQLGAPVVTGRSVGKAFYGAVDTGTTLLFVPSAIASAIWAAVPGAALDTADSGGGEFLYSYTCGSNPSIALTFTGATGSFAINPADLSIGTTSSGKCVGSIIGADFGDSVGNDIAIVGDVFLKSWYSVYDYANKRVGFAQALH